MIIIVRVKDRIFDRSPEMWIHTREHSTPAVYNMFWSFIPFVLVWLQIQNVILHQDKRISRCCTLRITIVVERVAEGTNQQMTISEGALNPQYGTLVAICATYHHTYSNLKNPPKSKGQRKYSRWTQQQQQQHISNVPVSVLTEIRSPRVTLMGGCARAP